MSSGPRRVAELPEWAREVVQSASPQQAPIEMQRGTPGWSLLVNAATVGSFAPRELAPSLGSGEERREAEQSVLELSELASESGAPRWMLTPESRRRVLAQCEPAEIEAALARSSVPDADPVTAALHDYLRGPTSAQVESTSTDFESMSMHQLEARRLAATWLRDVKHVSLPSIDELERHMELRRLLEPFERMVGRKPGRPPGDDRFFGRKAEVEDLREYVRVIAASSLKQRVARGIKSAVRAFTGRKPKTVWGTGGVGKTTLVAHFMLEHARAAQHRFPFAYLDFDRSTITVRNRASLLAEICRQAGAQFATLTPVMNALRRDLEAPARTIDLAPEKDSRGLIEPLARQFRTAIDEAFDDEPFLLVFDTFEIVQYAPDQVAALEELVRAFATTRVTPKSDSSDIWPRLRLIISGRRKVPEFLGGAEELELGPLDPEGSAQMLAALAADAGKPIGSRDATRLVDAIRQDAGGRAAGARPLRLRLVGELFREEGGDGPSIVHSLIEELENPSTEQKKLGRLFVDGILVRRILGHVRDANVRALADPGLVVRRITPEVIRDVMTRGTHDPRATAPADEDPISIEPWVIDDAEARAIFDAFRREVSLVEQDGEALRHRQDVREEMLPLIEKRRPNGFRRIHQLAFDYFRANAASGDRAAAEEAVYHGLRLGVPIEELEAIAPRGGLRIDAHEFSLDSPANLYVRAKNDEDLPTNVVTQLPTSVRMEWLGRRCDAWLMERRLIAQVETIRRLGGERYADLDAYDEVAARVARVLFRAGEWNDAMQLLWRHVHPQLARDGDAPISLVRTWLTITAKSGVEPDAIDSRWIVGFATGVSDPVVRSEMLAYATLAMRRFPALRELASELAAVLAKSAMQVRPSLWRRELRTLRLVIAANPGEALEPLLDAFVEFVDELPRDRAAAALIGDLLGTEGVFEEANALWRKERRTLVRRISPQALRRIAAADHGDWFLPLGNALTRAMDDRAFANHLLKLAALPEPIGAEEGRDGHALFQALVRHGNLIPFAEELARLDEPGVYPDTAPRLGHALVAWHRLTMGEDAPMAAMPFA